MTRRASGPRRSSPAKATSGVAPHRHDHVPGASRPAMLLDRILCGRMPEVALGEDGDAGRCAWPRRLGPRAASRRSIEPARTRRRETARADRRPATAARSRSAGTRRDRFRRVDRRAASTTSHRDPRWRAGTRERGASHAPGGESMLDVQARAWRPLRVAARAAERPVVMR